jgi:hypothetical protein
MNAPLVTTRPWKITPTETPARWTGIQFTCARCGALNQLEAGDQVAPIDGTATAFLTPSCPTPGCGEQSVIDVPELSRDEVRKLLEIGLEKDEEGWNPS